MRIFLLPLMVLGLVVSLLLGAELKSPEANPETPKLLFEETFEGKLAEGWSWLREDPTTWRIRDGALEIRVEPGVAATVKNALRRKAPEPGLGKVAIEVTVTFLTKPTNQYEQAGITWYHQDKPVFKLVHENIDGKTYIIPGRKPTDTLAVDLRLVLDGEKYLAQYRPAGQGQFQTAAEGKIPRSAEDMVSIQCYQGPPHAEHWIRFDNFRIFQLAP
ncbi:MAG: hypothetical protein NZ602_02625 [Thermoguttaceae bacterium]|nr:hypothetical protein [Thermoguttaceae bacterium]MDW8038088.1 hypothetical protein [Thermoguttaceae bacterium]